MKQLSWLSGKRGLMVHYLPEFPGNEQVDSFDLAGFLDDFDRSASDYLIFTLGQNRGFYCAPNEVIDRYAGPGRCSRRDLFGEIAAALAKRGKRMIAYLPCEIRGNTALHAGFGWNSADGTDQRCFQERWSEAIRYWSLRYGELISGWWFDGCYDWYCFHHDLLDYPLYRQAVQAGNPGALLTFNDGCYCIGHTRPFRDGFDYFAGEAVLLDPATGRPFLGPFTNAPVCPEEECVNAGTGVTPHLLVSTDAFWGHLNSAAAVLGDGPSLFRDPALLRPGEMELPLYSRETLSRTQALYCGSGGAVTFNAGIFPGGRLGPRTVELLSGLGR